MLRSGPQLGMTAPTYFTGALTPTTASSSVMPAIATTRFLFDASKAARHSITVPCALAVPARKVALVSGVVLAQEAVPVSEAAVLAQEAALAHQVAPAFEAVLAQEAVVLAHQVVPVQSVALAFKAVVLAKSAALAFKAVQV